MRTLLDLQITRDLARDSSLSDSDYDVLSTLSEGLDFPWRANALAERLLWSTSRLAHHVGRMERRGLVIRSTCNEDARGAVVALTERGSKVLHDAAPLHVQSVRHHFIDLLSTSEIESLLVFTDKVIKHLSSDVDVGVEVLSRDGFPSD
jgi:DNA-binding MarR family transcriptional regulator